MKISHLVSFLCGALLMLGIATVQQSQAQSPNHVFELRVYHANPGKLDALNKRFREHTISIFNKHDMKSVGYWVPQDNKDNVLIYMLEHPSREAATKDWAAFNADPEWVKVKAESEKDGKLVDHVDDTYMNPTDYSMLK
ncbi:MAG TPA: NIPSNAP family protein [Bryobacteraceae bacterium]|nr:NIPSNAP family protein [Bryobacteraceae bacterium]